MRNLKLEGPLVCFDLETTGVNVDRDRIVEIAMVRLEPDGARSTFRSLVNPGMPIPPGATAIHDISDADVADAPRFEQITAEVERILDGADLAGFNTGRFDIPLLRAEMIRAGSSIDLAGRRHFDAFTIFVKMEPRTLTAAYRKFCGGDLENAHSALADVEATLAVLDAQLEHYPDLPRDPDELHVFCNPDEGRFVDSSRKFVWNDDGRAVFTFGKYRDRSLEDVAAESRDYLEWMLKKDFSDEVTQILREALDGRFPAKG